MVLRVGGFVEHAVRTTSRRGGGHIREPLACVGRREGSLVEQKRFSFKYAQRSSMDEMRQPFFIHEKRYGIFSNERNIRKSRRGLPFITPLYTKHMNLWETDTDESTNRYFRSYVFGQRELSQLLGRPHGFETDDSAGRQGPSNYELNQDQRYMGVERPAITNLHYEPEWCYTLYRNCAHGNQLTNPRSPLTEEVLGPELLAIRDIKSVEHCKAWFDRLQYLIKLHYDAVGDVGEFKSRHTQHVHEFFVAFHDALSSFEFQDRYLLEQFHKVRPAALEDIFAIFLEMEANYVNEAYCPRCSLPFATTRYCGEGDAATPFRKHRGRWALHQRWGHEWFAVVARRAEALWYRATEDPYFGLPHHTQRQVEALMNVYVKTKQRAKAIDFVHALRGSKEFLLGHVQLTEGIQKGLDFLLDHTPHPHLITQASQLDNRAVGETGATHTALQMRLDLEMQKYRRQQREEGVVRVPPALWRVDTQPLVAYALDATKRLTNWRAVKAGIEASFLASGLPKAAYTAQEWRAMRYWETALAEHPRRRAALEAERQREARAAEETDNEDGKGMKSFLVFPDREWYRVFDTSKEALRRFGLNHSGEEIKATTFAFEDPAAVVYTNPLTKAPLTLDTTAEACRWYGDFEYGDVVELTALPNPDKGEPAAVVVLGVGAGTDGAGETDESMLYAMHVDPAVHARQGLVALGTDCLDIKQRFPQIRKTHRKCLVPMFDGGGGAADEEQPKQPQQGIGKVNPTAGRRGGKRTVQEECLGQVVGVRNGELYVQWRLLRGGASRIDRGVAVSLGPPERVRVLYRFQTLGVGALIEPPSWQTPFRNDFAEERLKALQNAPFQRERWASLISGKYTPKVKRFGYTQHTTQDDFETKEYKDRLLARQYFNNPQAFEVIPERHERSVRFGGKWEYQRTHGLPAVDRNELENGWGEQEPISDEEVKVVEQALRDISGRRPGNFIKAPRETQSLQLNESWWAPLGYGWEEHNREQQAFFERSEQTLIDGAGLPFKGRIPPFGTTYGIAERIREVAADFAKGFGLGPHGHSPTHDTAPFNTLAAEESRVQTLGMSHPLVRLFDAKLGSSDVHAWALEQCGRDHANVRHLLLSLHEWRERGRAPSLLLATVLARYLKAEVEAYNAELPKGVPRLQLPVSSALNSSSTDPNRLWAEVDSREYGYAYMRHHQAEESDEAYIPFLVQRAQLRGLLQQTALPAGLRSTLQQDVAQDFRLQLARIAGRGIPPALLTSAAGVQQQQARQSGHVVPSVRASELARLLRSTGVSFENVSAVIRGLAGCPEHRRLEAGGGAEEDFIVPIALVLSWSGPNKPAAGGGSKGGGGRPAVSAYATPGSRSAVSKGRDADIMVHLLEELQLRDDGAAMDIQYVIRENKRNPVLRQEFFNAFLPIYGMNHVKVSAIYEDYCEGKFVPNLREAIDVFVAFLGNFCKRPEQLTSQVEYFEVNHTGNHPGQYTQIKLLPPAIGPFIFDNIKDEVIQTTEIFQRYRIVAGPTSIRATSFIAPNSKDFNYFLSRKDSLVRLTPGNKDDFGRLHEALTRSPDFKAIAANPGLQLLLQSPSGVGLVVSFNRFFYRVAPMLTFFEEILSKYAETVAKGRASAQAANHGLARALENELSPALEQEFRRNAERYWRAILDGRHPAEMTTTNASGERSRTTGPSSPAGGATGSVLKQALGEIHRSPTAAPPPFAAASPLKTSSSSTLASARPSASPQNVRTASVLQALKAAPLPAKTAPGGGRRGGVGRGKDDGNDKRRPK